MSICPLTATSHDELMGEVTSMTGEQDCVMMGVGRRNMKGFGWAVLCQHLSKRRWRQSSSKHAVDGDKRVPCEEDCVIGEKKTR